MRSVSHCSWLFLPFHGVPTKELRCTSQNAPVVMALPVKENLR